MGNTSIKTTFRTSYFLTIAAGFWIGKIKVGQFSLGIVTSVLLVGVLVGQLNITIEEPVKSVFFLLFYLPSVTKWDRNSFVD